MEIPASSLINRYIACQGPLPNTCSDFWQMTWEQGSSMVVMLTTQVERGRVRRSTSSSCVCLFQLLIWDICLLVLSIFILALLNDRLHFLSKSLKSKTFLLKSIWPENILGMDKFYFYRLPEKRKSTKFLVKRNIYYCYSTVCGCRVEDWAFKETCKRHRHENCSFTHLHSV